MGNPLVAGLGLAVISITITGCGSSLFASHQNARSEGDCRAIARQTAASLVVPHTDRFVGLAFSGGGSRAANFAAAALFELEELGLMSHVDGISAVSGGGLAAAYYKRFRHEKARWNKQEVTERFGKHYEARWFTRWFLPWNFLAYWTTAYDRTDIMRDVLDANLFEGAKFRDLDPQRPRLWLNATLAGRGGLPWTNRPFVFSDEAFQDLCSRLDTYPLSGAVMASGAFPGVFQSVTLKNYEWEGNVNRRGLFYSHLFDGGPADNLGITGLQAALARLPEATPCLFIVIDANIYPTYAIHRGHTSDARFGFDYVIDTNFQIAIDVMMWRQRAYTAREFGFAEDGLTTAPFRWAAVTTDGRARACSVWWVSFERLVRAAETRGWESIQSLVSEPIGRERVKGKRAPDRRTAIVWLQNDINHIDTRYTLTGPGNFSGGEIQRLLFQAAKLLVTEDHEMVACVCRWFSETGDAPERCRGVTAGCPVPGNSTAWHSGRRPHSASP